MTELQLVDEWTPDWEDVLRRARTRRAPAVALALLVAAVAVASALAIVLTRDARATLPKEADRSNVVVVVQPLTGRVLVQAAPWKSHDGICYAVLFLHSACVPRVPGRTVVLAPPLAGYSFDRRVAAGNAVTPDGKHVPLIVRRFGGRVSATFFVSRGRLPHFVRAVVLRDAGGRVVFRWNHR
jgi:hypothetical protein